MVSGGDAGEASVADASCGKQTDRFVAFNAFVIGFQFGLPLVFKLLFTIVAFGFYDEVEVFEFDVDVWFASVTCFGFLGGPEFVSKDLSWESDVGFDLGGIFYDVPELFCGQVEQESKDAGGEGIF